MYIAGRLNFLHSQASVALDHRATPKDRDYATGEISDTVARLPAISLSRAAVSMPCLSSAGS